MPQDFWIDVSPLFFLPPIYDLLHMKSHPGDGDIAQQCKGARDGHQFLRSSATVGGDIARMDGAQQAMR